MSNTTGNKIVDEISALHINSIPETWYHTIKRNNQPHAMAILILWDLVYWYKWTEVRDETSGLVIGYKKKFKADLLQRSYEAIGNKFGISKRQATDVIVFLEKMGAVKRVFRNIRVANTTLSNVLFIELVPSVIKELCNADLGEVSRNCVGGYHADSGDGLSELGETYTTTSTNNTTTNNNNISEVDTSDFPEDPNEIKSKKTTRSKKPSKTELNEQFISTLSPKECIESEQASKLLISYLKPLQPTMHPENHIRTWQVEFAKFMKENNVSYDNLIRVINFAFASYWEKYTFAAKNIIDNYGKIYQQMTSNYKSNYQKQKETDLERGNMDTGKRDYTL